MPDKSTSGSGNVGTAVRYKLGTGAQDKFIVFEASSSPPQALVHIDPSQLLTQEARVGLSSYIEQCMNNWNVAPKFQK